MSCDWEGNRRSGVAMAMGHRLKWFMIIHLRAQGLSTNTSHGVWYSLPFILYFRVFKSFAAVLIVQNDEQQLLLSRNDLS